MKKIFLVFLLIVGISNGASFTVDDPPMFYIFNFVTYDNIAIVDPNPKKYDILEIPLAKEEILSTTNNLILKEELNPKLLSAMVTTAVSDYSQIKIAGESIQERIKHDNIMYILDSYDYLEETDYIFIGEINTLAQQFEIDLKIIDVSQQIILNSKYFQIPFNEINNLRTEITKYVKFIMDDFLAPFTGIVSLHTDSIGIGEIQEEMIVIRSISSKVGSDKSLNLDKDFKRFKLKDLDTKHKEYFSQYLNKFPDNNFKIITSDNTDGFQFLEGEYIARIYLKNNKGFCEVPFTVKPGMLNEIKYLPEREIIPKKILPKKGILNIHGMGDNTVVNIFNIIDSTDFKPTCHIYNGKSNYDITSDILVDLDQNNNECNISNLPFGSYIVSAYNMSEEIFPGKASVDYLQLDTTLAINENENKHTININDNIINNNKSIIIYFNPFPESPEEIYALYLPNSYIPMTLSQKAGELHIHNFPDSLNDSIYVFREGYKIDVLSLNRDTNKQYLYANLSVREDGEILLENKRDGEHEFYWEIDEIELLTNTQGPHHVNNDFSKSDTLLLADTKLDAEDKIEQQLLSTEKQIQEKDIITKDSPSKEQKIDSISVSEKPSSFNIKAIKTFLSVGVSQPGLMGQPPGAYNHNPVQTGFNLKIGARESLNKFFQLPDYLPLSAQIGLGFQINQSIISEDLLALTLNIDALYNFDHDIATPGFSPLLGLKFDASIYETYTAYLLGLQFGILVDYDLSDLITKGLNAELLLTQSLDFCLSGNTNPFLAMVYFNLGISYTFDY
ncbi:MAG: hypothetical protein WCZ21_05380 [Bacteroidales bacterium]